jgi:hypothetical protein
MMTTGLQYLKVLLVRQYDYPQQHTKINRLVNFSRNCFLLQFMPMSSEHPREKTRKLLMCSLQAGLLCCFYLILLQGSLFNRLPWGPKTEVTPLLGRCHF